MLRSKGTQATYSHLDAVIVKQASGESASLDDELCVINSRTLLLEAATGMRALVSITGSMRRSEKLLTPSSHC